MRILVGVTGASGMIYAKRLLLALGKEASVIVSDSGKKVAELELGEELGKGAAEVFDNADLAAKPASGSSRYDAMVIVPCSMKTLGAIANGISANLITRAADAMLKQEKKVILVTRETPLSLVHLRNMVAAKEAGASILPACPGFYHKPKRIEDLADFIAGRALELLGKEHALYKRWKE